MMSGRDSACAVSLRIQIFCVALLSLIANAVCASTSPPHYYYVLGPESLAGPLTVMSLEPNDTIGVGGFSITLQKYESASIPAQMFTVSSKLAVVRTAGSEQVAFLIYLVRGGDGLWRIASM